MPATTQLYIALGQLTNMNSLLWRISNMADRSSPRIVWYAIDATRRMCEVYPANIVRLSNAVLGQTIGENNQAGRQPFSLKQNLVSIFCPSDSSRISLRPIFQGILQRFQRPVPASFLGLVIPSTSHSDNFRLGESILISMVPWSNRR